MSSWRLDPAVTHLNHGSFGACPTAVLEEQSRWQMLMEINPVRFFTETLQPALDHSRLSLAEFLRTDPLGLVFVPNATAGVNAVLRSLEPSLGPGDEILITDHTYNACRNVAAVTALRSGAQLVEVPVPFPLDTPQRFSEAVLARISARTRVVMVDWVTSPTAVVVPIADIVGALEPQIPVLVDAAHAPGMVPMDLGALGASYVVGNCHKWLCAPKSAGFLSVRDDRQADLIPATVSHGWNTEPLGGVPQLHNLFDWTGTDDPSARLTVPIALATMAGLRRDGWNGVMASNRSLVLRGREIICAALGIDEPIDSGAIGSMATVPLPGEIEGDRPGDLEPLTQRLRDDRGIEVPVFAWRDWPSRLLRLSAQLYNTETDYQRLAEALASEI